MPLQYRFDIFKNLDGFHSLTLDEDHRLLSFDSAFPSLLLKSKLSLNKPLKDTIDSDFFGQITEHLQCLSSGGISNFKFKYSDKGIFQVLMVCFSDEHSTFIKLGIKSCFGQKNTQPIIPILLHAINTLSEGIIITDSSQEDDPIIYVNDSLCRLSGYDHKDFLGKNCRFLSKSPNKDVEESTLERKNLKSAIDEGRPIVSHINNYKITGEKFVNELSLTPVKNLREEVTHFIGVQRDYTAMKNLEISNLLLIQGLQQSNFQLDHFANIAAHDLQAPLAKAINFLYLIEDSLKNNEPVSLSMIQNASNSLLKMQTMTKSILQNSKSNASLHDRKKIDLNQCLTQAIENLEQLISESETIIDRDELPSLYANEVEFCRVFMNLISNAIKYRSTNTPIIKIEYVFDKNTHFFSVSDNGIGIPEDQREFVLGFLRKLGDGPNSNGIGLSICRTIIQNLDGEIWVEDSALGGTKVMFSIPDTQLN